MKTIKTGIIGTGHLGKFHVQKYDKIENSELVGIADVDEKTVNELAEKHGCRAFSDYKEMLELVDAVSIAAPTPLHYKIAKDCLEKKVDVLLEKPITVTTEEADELIELAEKNDCVIQVGHIERYNPAVRALKNHVKNPRYVEAVRQCMYKVRGTDVSVILDLMIHDIDIVCSFIDADVVGIEASGLKVISDEIDIANARLTFSNGAVASITANRVAEKNDRIIKLFEDNQSSAVDFNTREITITGKCIEIEGQEIPGVEIKKLDHTASDALEDEVRDFLDAVEHRTVPAICGKTGRDALTIALEVERLIKNA